MVLAFALFKYFPYGGLERDFLRIAKECQSRGHEVFVYSMSWQGHVPSGFNLTVIPVKGLSNHQRIRSFSKKLSDLLRKEQFDLVVGFNKMKDLDLYYGADPCYEAKVREKYGMLYRLCNRYKVFQTMEASVFATDKQIELLFLSNNQMETFKQIYHTPAERFHLLPPGVDRSRIRPDNADEVRANVRQTLQLKDDDKLLLMIGTGYKRKGVDRSMEALASLPEPLRRKTFLLVAGEDKLKRYQALAVNLKIKKQVHLPGGREDIPELLLASDLFLHPARQENTGTVLLEAVVAGIPQLISGVCGYAFHIKKARAGQVLSEPFEQAQFNQHLYAMLTSNRLQQWQENALQYMRSSDIFSMPSKAADIIEATGKARSLANIYQNNT